MIFRKIVTIACIFLFSGTLFPMYRPSKKAIAPRIAANSRSEKKESEALYVQNISPEMDFKILTQFSFPAGNEKLAKRIAQSPFCQKVWPYDLATLPLKDLKTINMLNEHFEVPGTMVIDVDKEKYNAIVNLIPDVKNGYRKGPKLLKAAVGPDLSTQVTRVIVPMVAGAVVGGLGGGLWSGAQSAINPKASIIDTKDFEAFEEAEASAHVDAFCEAYQPAFDSTFGPLSEQTREEQLRKAYLEAWLHLDDEQLAADVLLNKNHGPMSHPLFSPREFHQEIEQYSDNLAGAIAHEEASKIATAAGVLAAQALVFRPTISNSSFEEMKSGAALGAASGAFFGFGEGCKHLNDYQIKTAIPNMHTRI